MSKSFFGRVLPVFVVVSLIILAGCEPAEPVENVESGARAIATFEGGEITQAELDEAVEQVAQAQGVGEVSPDSPEYELVVSQVMPELVRREISEAYARENDIRVTEEDIDGEIETIKDELAAQAEQVGEDVDREEAYRQALEQAGFTEEELRRNIREGFLPIKVQEEIAGEPEIPDEEVQAFYDENRDLQFSTPEQRCLRHILFNPDQEGLAEEVRGRLEDGEDFAELAQEFSQDPGSAENGGDLGCQGQGSFVPEFEDAAFGAEEGEIVGPVETEFGFHLIEVTETQPESVQPLEEVAPEIRDQLVAQRQSEEVEEWVAQQEEERNLRYLPGFDPEAPAEEQPEGEETGAEEETAPQE